MDSSFKREICVIKRDGSSEPFDAHKITERIQRLANGIPSQGVPVLSVDVPYIASIVCRGVADNMHTKNLDELAAEEVAQLSKEHYEYGVLAARIAVSNLHKEMAQMELQSFSQVTKALHGNTKRHRDRRKAAPIVSEAYAEFVASHANVLDNMVCIVRDFDLNYFGFKTLERSYLKRDSCGRILECPQYLIMREAVAIHMPDGDPSHWNEPSVEAALDRIKLHYESESKGYFTHATPTKFNAGCVKQQMSSCFLLTMQKDSIEGIYDTLKQCANISKNAGGIGIGIHKIRAKGSYIEGTNGISNGLVPMLRVYNNTARYVDQGGGKRKGAFAAYLEPWHADIKDFLQLKKNHGKEERRARDLFYAMWTPDLFMKRVSENGNWSLFCPNEAPGLHECWGEEFEKKYVEYERTPGLARETMKARELMDAIVTSQCETGTPYMLYKDQCNRTSNQQHLGTIQSSNLCTEVVQFTSPEEVAVCNLASLALPKFVKKNEDGYMFFDHQHFMKIVGQVVENLERVIDRNYYPVKEARHSNMRHRPMGIGVQGLADTFTLMGYCFTSPEAQKLNVEIFQSLYFAAVDRSCSIAKVLGHYPSYPGSPASKGMLQPDLWGMDRKELNHDLHDWDGLYQRVDAHGLRHSLLVAPMPTASTSQILGNSEGIDPRTSNLYVRRTSSGEFVVANKYLHKSLIEQNLWTPEIRAKILKDYGSVQDIEEIPKEVKQVFKTVWELGVKEQLKMAADRGRFICQSQSLNVHMENTEKHRVIAMHLHGWKLGLTTGMYYLRGKAAVEAIQFTVDKALKAGNTKEDPQHLPEDNQQEISSEVVEGPVCMLGAGAEGCLSCGS